ncbi:MAG: glycosyltransferase [Saprospiraceae bacterium]|nr:glycosyltransferase [Saprospiraceae bacterium]
MTFDVTIPVLNEEATLAQNVRILHAFLKMHFPEQGQWRIVIADNGSTDRTPEIGRELMTEFRELAFVKVPEKGVGLALKTSWGQSNADIVGYMDLDLATALPHFLEAYEALAAKNYDIVYATRLHRRSKVIGRSLKREIASRGFNLLLKFCLGIRFSDGMCGFKFLKRNVFQVLYNGGAQNDGWFFSTELLVVAEWKNLKIFELPVTWTDDTSSSRVQVIPLAKKYLAAMWALRRKKYNNPDSLPS